MAFNARRERDLDGSSPADDGEGRVPRLDRRRLLVGLAAGGVAGLAGCMDDITDHEFEAESVRIPSEDVERFGLQQVEEDEIVVEEERSIAGQGVRAEATSHVVGYEATAEAGGEGQLRTTRDVATEEVLVTVPGAALLDADEDIVREVSDVGRLLPGEFLVGEDRTLETGEYPASELTPTATHVFFPGETWDELGLDELHHAVHDDVQSVASATDLPTDGVFDEDLEAIPFEALEEALELGVPEEQVERLLQSSNFLSEGGYVADVEDPEHSEDLEPSSAFPFSLATLDVADPEHREVLEQGVVMFPGDHLFPGDSWTPGDTFFPGDHLFPGDSWIPGDTFFPGDHLFPGDSWIPGDTFFPGDHLFPGDAFDEGSAFVADTGDIEDRHDIEVGRLELLEAGGVLIPGGTWDADSNGAEAPVPAISQSLDSAGALSTPKAEVMGQTLNPYADASPEELLTDEEIRSFVGRLGLDGLDDGWLEGPERADSEVGRLLGEDAPVETFVGLVGSREDPEFAVVHVGRLDTGDDVVFSAVASTDGVDQVGRVFVGEDGYVTESDLGTRIETALDVVETFET